MAIEYGIRFDETLRTTAAGFVLKSNRLGSSFPAGTGCGSDPASGSGLNPAVGSGLNAAVGSGLNPAVGSGLNPAVGSGLNPAVGSGGCGGSVRSGPGFPFQVETQEESDWCWAAVASAVDRYYSPLSFLSQCEVASELLTALKPAQPVDACIDPDDSNQPEALEDALIVVGRDGQNLKELTFEQLQMEIDAGRPVGVSITWEGGGGQFGHFVVFCGYAEWSGGLKTVDVADPFYPDSTQDFDQFPDSYHGGGTLTQTYFTK